MNSPGYDDPSVWEDMRQRLMGLTVKQLKQIAKDEGISLGYAASRKDSMVGEIVTARRHRILERNRGESYHSWRKWNSLNIMPIKHQVDPY